MDQSKVTAIITSTRPADPANGIPHGIWLIKVEVFDASGQLVTLESKTPVSMSGGNNIEGDPVNATIDTRASKEDPSTYHTFSYIPASAGEQSLTFASGSASTPLSIHVQ